MAELGRECPEVKNEGYNNKTLQQNPNEIKREINQILQGCWRRLKLRSKKEHDLQRHEARETRGGKGLTDVEVIRRKEAKITKKEGVVRNTVILLISRYYLIKLCFGISQFLRE